VRADRFASRPGARKDERIGRPTGRETMRRRRSVFRTDPNADPMINTTPLIDVMLVILVMFIITIPPPTHSVDVTLPQDAPIPAPVRDENHITIDTADVIRWNDKAVDLAELGQLVKAASDRPEPATLMFEPEARARYLRVDEAIGAIRRNGGTRIAFPGIYQYGGLI
jgi:biopolymer transport protein ExbD